MPRDLTEAQLANLELASTRPVYCVWLEHSGSAELLSSSGPVVYNTLPFVGGGVNVKKIVDSRNATLTLSASATRIAEVQNGTWRNGRCIIYAIPADPGEDSIYTAEEGVTLLDGVIDDSKYSDDVITIQAIHSNLDGNLTPRNTYDEVANHIPAPGTVIAWDNETLVLESR